jgi:hypothetical protein
METRLIPTEPVAAIAVISKVGPNAVQKINRLLVKVLMWIFVDGSVPGPLRDLPPILIPIFIALLPLIIPVMGGAVVLDKAVAFPSDAMKQSFGRLFNRIKLFMLGQDP